MTEPDVSSLQVCLTLLSLTERKTMHEPVHKLLYHQRNLAPPEPCGPCPITRNLRGAGWLSDQEMVGTPVATY